MAAFPGSPWRHLLGRSLKTAHSDDFKRSLSSVRLPASPRGENHLGLELPLTVPKALFSAPLALRVEGGSCERNSEAWPPPHRRAHRPDEGEAGMSAVGQRQHGCRPGPWEQQPLPSPASAVTSAVLAPCPAHVPAKVSGVERHVMARRSPSGTDRADLTLTHCVF